MEKILRNILILASVSMMSQVSAASFFFGNYGVDLVSDVTLRLPDNSTLMSASITEGNFSYDPLTGSSSGSLSAVDTTTGSDYINIYNMSVFETSYGSLFMSGQMDALGATGINIQAEMAVNYDYDMVSDVTIFSLYTLDTDGDGIAGIMINDGSPFTGVSVDINGSMALLAYVDNPFPTYVPVPAAVWLFGSGLLGLLAFGKRRA